jgi:hypothetical protein
MMVKLGKLRVANTLPGQISPICVFETVAGDTFSVERPLVSQAEEIIAIPTIREAFQDESRNISLTNEI